MDSARARSNMVGPHKGSKPLQVCGGTLLALVCFTLHGCIGTTATAQHQAQHPVAATIYSRPGAPLGIDSKPKLLGFNRALGERLLATEATLRPLKTRAARLEHRFHVFQQRACRQDRPNRKDTTTARRTERNGLLREAQQLRADVERKWQRFGELERNYRSMRRLLPGGRRVAAGVPRAWLDHDTERQMALNERVYKNIINLLVQLIECPVNIIHDMVGGGGGAGEPTPLPSTTAAPFPDGDGADPAVEDEYTDGGLYGDEQPPNPDAELQEARENGSGSDRFLSSDEWLHEFHF